MTGQRLSSDAPSEVAAFKTSVRQHIEPTLVCPKCRSSNRKGVIVHIEDHGEAHCDNCAHHGKIRDFQKER